MFFEKIVKRLIFRNRKNLNQNRGQLLKIEDSPLKNQVQPTYDDYLIFILED